MAESQLPPQPMLVQTGMLTPGFSQSVLSNTLTGASNLYAQLALKVVQYIQSVLADAVNTYQGVARQAATPIVNGLNQAQATIDQLGTQVRNSLQAGLASATAPCQSGCATEQGAKPGQYTFNVWQDLDRPAAVFLVQNSTDKPESFGNWCFRGGWDDQYDAIAFKGQIQGTTPLGGCPLPGGPAVSPPPPPPPAGGGPIQVGGQLWWAWWNCANTPLGVVTAKGVVPPASPIGYSQINGDYATQAAAQADIDQELSEFCTSPPNQTQQWYGGCVSGSPTTWLAGQLAPAGATDIVGPFSSQSDALAAASAACAVTPPPPPQPTGPCQCIATAPGQCVMVDLCDWQKFEDHLAQGIYRALCMFTKDPQCRCETRDAERYTIEDCGGEYAQQVQAWAGQYGGVLSQTPDDLVAAVTGYYDGADLSASPPIPLSPPPG